MTNKNSNIRAKSLSGCRFYERDHPRLQLTSGNTPPPLLLPVGAGSKPEYVSSQSIPDSDTISDPDRPTDYITGEMSRFDGSACYCHLLSGKKRKRRCAVCRLTQHYKTLLAKQKLTARNWRIFLISLGLNCQMLDLSARHARFVRHLLDYLLVHSDLLTREKASADDFKR